MKYFSLILIAFLSLVNTASAACSESAIQRLITKLGKAERRVDALETQAQNLGQQRLTVLRRKESRLQAMNDRKDRYIFDLGNLGTILNCGRYPDQCVTQADNFLEQISRINQSIANTERTFNEKLAKLDQRVARLEDVTIPGAEAYVEQIRSRVEACNA